MTSFRDFEHAGWSDNSVAQSYHQHLGHVTVGCILDLLDAARFKRDDRVLDVACGAGYVAAAAHDRGAEAVGVDLSAPPRSGWRSKPIRASGSSRATPKRCRSRMVSSPPC